MGMKVFRETETDISALRGTQIAILGYGSQGRAHALNLRDSSLSIAIAQRSESKNFEQAVKDGFHPVAIPDAVRNSELIVFALPDEQMGDIYAREIRPNLHQSHALGFIHGFAIRFGLVVPPPNVDVIMVAPKGPGPLVRDAFTRGDGVAAIVAVHQDATGKALNRALAWGAGIGCARRGLIEATFAQECESDLFGEQTVLTGGVIELMKAAYETLVEAGYPEELAYFECIHELKQIVDLQYAGGLELVRSKISRTASYGGLTRGRRMVTDQMRADLRAILNEIKSGQFAKEWVEESRAGSAALKRLISEEAAHSSEQAGRKIRSLSK